MPRLDRLAHVRFMKSMFAVCRTQAGFNIKTVTSKYNFNLVIVVFTFLMTRSFIKGRRCPSQLDFLKKRLATAFPSHIQRGRDDRRIKRARIKRARKRPRDAGEWHEIDFYFYSCGTSTVRLSERENAKSHATTLNCRIDFELEGSRVSILNALEVRESVLRLVF